MASGLIRKIVLWISILLALFITIMAVLCFSNMLYGSYPHEKAEEWGCEDPKMVLRFHQDENKLWDFSEVLFWNNEAVDISIGFGKGVYCVYPATSNHYEDRLFEGTWKYRKGNLVLIVEEDFIFDNQYSEIILSPVKN